MQVKACIYHGISVALVALNHMDVKAIFIKLFKPQNTNNGYH